MLKIVCLFLLLGIVALWTVSQFIARDIEQEFPPVGKFLEVDGAKLHFVDTGGVDDEDKPAIVFIHGASGNLRDPMTVYLSRLDKDFRLVFVDRPGHGYSDSFEDSNDPKSQAAVINGLLVKLGIEKAIVVGHSFGGVITAAFGVLYPERTSGLVFIAPVSHPWGTGVDWHYDVGNTPIIGWLFSNLIAPIGGSLIYPNAVKNVFSPNPMPKDYKELSGTRLVLRPKNFHENAKDVARVEAHVTEFNHRYREITAPTAIFHGDNDDIVSLEIHSINGLAKDIKGARLNILAGVGHKPDYVAADQVEKEIRRIASLSDTGPSIAANKSDP